ncbi:phage tail protein [Mesorhizobium sp. B2-5-9]|uniref:tail protein X n=1 Tax=Mesorhizobium sp. B2-5-9 TaxID=2589921 RepID=UPI00112AAE83|nr:tail protein X [Mesorhizobium sp. B2-5-9]TPK15155.1 phage tail protein [Mesorhizobium sp. B2-5-9]
MSVYTTQQGEVADLVCSRFYGRTKDVTEAVLVANPGLAAKGPVLPFATQITMPDGLATPVRRPLVSLYS